VLLTGLLGVVMQLVQLRHLPREQLEVQLELEGIKELPLPQLKLLLLAEL